MTANQKLLRDFLQNLLDTIIIAPQKLEPVKSGTIRTLEGLESVERALLALYNALALIESNVIRPGIAPLSPDGAVEPGGDQIAERRRHRG